MPGAGRALPAGDLILSALHRAGFAMLTVDLLASAETSDGAAAFQTAVLAPRLVAVTRWLAAQPEARGKRLAYLASGLAAGTALWAAAEPGVRGLLSAVIALNGRVDLAASRLAQVSAPALLIVNRRDRLVLEANRAAARRLNASSRLVVAPSFRYLRYALRDPGRLEALLAVEWCTRHLAGVAPEAEPRRRSLLDAWPAHGRAAAAATVMALVATLVTTAQPAVGATNLTLSAAGGTLTYTGANVFESLTVTEASNQNTYTLASNVAINPDPVAAANGCANTASNQVTCPASAFGDLVVDMTQNSSFVRVNVRDGFPSTTVDGGANHASDFLIIDDSAQNGSDAIAVTGSAYSRAGLGPIHYSNLDFLSAVAEGGANAISILSTSANTTVNGGAGNDAITVGSGGTLDAIHGPLAVFGGGGTDTVVIDDHNTGTSSTYKSGFAPRAGVAPISDQSGDIEVLQVIAGSGNDVLDASGFGGQVSLFGNGGNDTLTGGNGDYLDGGTGTDRVVATSDSVDILLSNSNLILEPSGVTDTLAGIDEASLTGGPSANIIDASAFGNGPVTLVGLGGDDTLFGSNQSDSLLGGDGNDFILGAGGNDTISGGPGNDRIDGGPGTDRIVESGGNFTLTNSSLTGFAGTDSLSGIDEASLTGGGGNDVLDASGYTLGPVTLDGAGGNNTLTGGAGNDCLVGGLGTNELLVSGAGDGGPDVFSLTDSSFVGTNRGTDTLSSIQSAVLTGSATAGSTLNAFGFSGPVTLTGGAGNDFLQGGAGNDSIDGGAGNDTLGATATVSGTTMTLSPTSLVGGAGVGTDSIANIEFASLVGSNGNDVLDASNFGGSVTLRGLLGDDTLLGSPQSDVLDGGDGTDWASYLITGNVTLTAGFVPGGGNDTLISIEKFLFQGGPGPNTIDASGFGSAVVLAGGGGNDLLIGTPFNDTLLGGDGNDTLVGGGGVDSINGGAGSDVVVDSGDANFTLTPTLLSGNDTATLAGIEQVVLTGGVSSNIFNVAAFTGTVNLFGAEGDDTFILGPGGGTVDGGVGAGDQISMTADVPTLTLTDATLTGNGSYQISNVEKASLSGGPGKNLIDASGFSGNTTLSGQAGNDTLLGGPGNDVLLGGAGDDSLSGGPGANSLDGGLGGTNDRWVENGDFNISLVPQGLLGEQDDTVTNIESASIAGGPGDNSINLTGFTGDATIDGGAGNDSLTGGLGSDSLIGNAGNDTLVASPGNDTLDGGDGTDQIFASGNYTFTLTDARLDRTDSGGTVSARLLNIETAHLVGGNQDNLIDASAFGASQPTAGQVTLEGLDGNDTLLAGHGDASLDGGSGSDSLVGGSGNDTLLGDGNVAPGGADADTLLGGAGNDFLNGGFGNDSLDGGAGNDVLIGASGNDTMIGGPGDDTISAAFDVAPDSTPGNDLVSGGPGNNSIDGGPGQDTLTESGATSYAFKGNSLASSQGTDVFSNIEAASLTSADSASLFDLVAFTGTVTAVGGLGNDTFFGSAFGDSLDGGAGTDRLVITASAAITSVNFTLTDAALTGFGAPDTLANLDEASLTGTSGPDTLDASGFSGNVTLDGGAGADSLVGGHGDDCLLGGDANDTLTGGPGSNLIFGGLGNNLLTESAAPMTTTVQFTLTNGNLLGLGTDVVTNTMDVLSNTLAVSLTGGQAGDLMDISAFTGTATLNGGAGDDTFVGGPGNGNSSVDGGPAGNDLLVETGDMSMLLTNTSLTRTSPLGSVLGVDTLNSIDRVSLTGGDSANTLDASGFTGPATLSGGAGNDTLTGSRGNDVLDGGPDVNLLVASGEDVSGVQFSLTNNFLTRVDVSGTQTASLLNLQAVSLTGSLGADTLDASGNSRPVTLVGLAGNDRLIGGPAGDRLDGGDGNDTLTGNGGGDTLFGDAGTDLMVENADSNFTLTNLNLIDASFNYVNGIEAASLTGGPSNNTLDAFGFTAGPVTLDGGDGNDLLIGTINGDVLRGGAGDDTLKGSGGSDSLDGQAGTDLLVANGDQNYLLSNTAMTVTSGALQAISTLAGIEDASLTGGPGNNTLNAAAFSGPVTLVGGDGNDLLVGGSQNDSLIGGNGADTLTGGPGDNTLDGGPGTDVVSEFANANFTLLPDSLTWAGGTDHLQNIESASLAAGPGGHLLDATGWSGPVTLLGGTGNDTLLSGSGDDYLDGGAGNDSLNGGAGNNTLLGNAGNDTLVAGAGANTIGGGPGTDTVVEAGDVNFTLTDSSLTGVGTAAISGVEQASLTGGASDNSFDLQGWTGSATIDGAAGTDALSVAGTAGDDAPILTGSQVTFGAATTTFANVEHLAVFGGAGNDVFTVPDLGVSQANGPQLASALTDLTLSGGAGNDTFNLVPQDLVTITVDGGDQPAGGADTLNFDAQRHLTTPLPGELQVLGKRPVFYAGIEVFNLIHQAYQVFLSIVSR